MPITNGEIEETARAPAQLRGASWSGDGIIWSGSDAGIWRLEMGETEPERISTPRPTEDNHMSPLSLPDERGLIFAITRGTQSPSIAHLSLETGEHRSFSKACRKLITAT